MLLLLMGACLVCSVICAILLLKDVLGLSLPRRRFVNKAVPGLNFEKCLQWLNEEKCLPLTSGGCWKLQRNCSGLRLWQHARSEDKSWPPVCAVTTRVKTSSQHLFGFVRDVERFCEWRCNLLEVVRHAPTAPSASGNSATLPAAHGSSGSDSLVLTRSWCNGHCPTINGLLAAVMPAQSQILERCWQTEEGSVQWVLEAGCLPDTGNGKEAQLPDFTLYVTQPVISRENDLSLLTVVTTRHAADIAQDVCCLQDFFISHRSRVHAAGPLTLPSCIPRPMPTSAVKLSRSDSQQNGRVVGASPVAAMAGNTNNSSSPASDLPLPGCTRRSATGDTRSISSAGTSPFEESYESTGTSSFRAKLEGVSMHGHHSIVGSEEELTGIGNTSLSVAESGNNLEQGDLLNSAAMLSLSPDLSSVLAQSQEITTSTGVDGAWVFVPGKEDSLAFAPPVNGEHGLIDYRTLSNQCAADVIREVFRASSITSQLRRRVDDDGTATGEGSGLSPMPSSYGWTFQCTEKDVVVLRKHGTEAGACPESWIGKGLVKASPDAVWQCVSNPKTRFLYDDLLKAVEVVADMGGGMKLVRLYYESGHQLLRRRRGTGAGGADSHEFYVLQSERPPENSSDRDGGKRLLCLHSVDCPEPQLKDTPRGKFHSSGWLIEPVPRKDGRSGMYTMVTYLSQIQLNADAAAALHEEIIIKQPLSICALREYLSLPVAAV